MPVSSMFSPSDSTGASGRSEAAVRRDPRPRPPDRDLDPTDLEPVNAPTKQRLTVARDWLSYQHDRRHMQEKPREKKPWFEHDRQRNFQKSTLVSHGAAAASTRKPKTVNLKNSKKRLSPQREDFEETDYFDERDVNDVKTKVDFDKLWSDDFKDGKR